MDTCVNDKDGVCQVDSCPDMTAFCHATSRIGGRLIFRDGWTRERDILRAENAVLRCLIAISDTMRANACKSVERLQADAAALREVVEWVIYRCEYHLGVDGNPNWGADSEEYTFLKEALSSTSGAAMLRVVEAARALMAQRKQMNVNGPPKDKTKALAEVGEMLSRTDALDAALTGLDGEPHAITDAQMQAVMDMDAIGEQAVADLDAGSATCTKERER